MNPGILLATIMLAYIMGVITILLAYPSESRRSRRSRVSDTPDEDPRKE